MGGPKSVFMTLSRKQKAFLEIATACLESLHLIYMPYFTLHNPDTVGENHILKVS